MIGGHYTAYARLPSDKNSQRSDVGQCAPASGPPGEVIFREKPWSPGFPAFPLFPPGWRLFDDSTVTMVEESQVVTRYAYVLFYRRRNSPVERPAPFHRPGGAESPTAAGAAASQVRPDPSLFTIWSLGATEGVFDSRRLISAEVHVVVGILQPLPKLLSELLGKLLFSIGPIGTSQCFIVISFLVCASKLLIFFFYYYLFFGKPSSVCHGG